jgi:hypothetical protein
MKGALVRDHGVFRALILALLAASCASATAARGPARAPEFPRRSHWIGTPATWEDLRGQVVLIKVWTFG